MMCMIIIMHRESAVSIVLFTAITTIATGTWIHFIMILFTLVGALAFPLDLITVHLAGGSVMVIQDTTGIMAPIAVGLIHGTIPAIIPLTTPATAMGSMMDITGIHLITIPITRIAAQGEFTTAIGARYPEAGFTQPPVEAAIQKIPAG